MATEARLWRCRKARRSGSDCGIIANAALTRGEQDGGARLATRGERDGGALTRGGQDGGGMANEDHWLARGAYAL